MSATAYVPAQPRIIGPKIGPRPSWAKALIVAEYETDQSDSQTDYFATKTELVIPLAWSTHTRDIFSEMRKAAATFKPTRHLGPGNGNYTALVVFDIPAPGYFYSNGINIHDGERNHCSEHEPRTFWTKVEADAWIAAQKPLERCWYGETLISYRWSLAYESIEHREKYSMGSGYYLKASGGYSTGWTVSKRAYDIDHFGLNRVPRVGAAE